MAPVSELADGSLGGKSLGEASSSGSSSSGGGSTADIQAAAKDFAATAAKAMAGIDGLKDLQGDLKEQFKGLEGMQPQLEKIMSKLKEQMPAGVSAEDVLAESAATLGLGTALGGSARERTAGL